MSSRPIDRPFAWHRASGTATCRRCRSGVVGLADVAEAARWHAVHRSGCTPPSTSGAKVLDFTGRLASRTAR
ncbi:hypothetical protein F7Q99_39120 [Streptomyces kaniharaensis]|uniref:Uncharacterized protein n=1 Tax=Streptomyces kaniharaensis TaxID=212423 RepID=A0A6N7L669_9ACTN|nr:hypothetical protein [Streptomyces kaniharaensis]MQS18007.1 hypothetical protein [Streptomyces kaniharaensis]MQS18044.1 hypothetical protein [Streptomyces kaniharaensis]